MISHRLRTWLALAWFVVFSAHCRGGEQASRATEINLGTAASAGYELSDNDARKLEEQIRRDPHDAPARAKLLGYTMARQFKSREAVKSRREQVLWMIENLADNDFSGSGFCQIDPISDPEGYAQARDLWQKQIERTPQSAPVLAHAAQFLLLHDQDAAQSLLQRAEKADPNNPQWPGDLGHLHMLGISRADPADQQKRASQALAEFEKAMELTVNPREKFYVLSDVANAALISGDKTKAKTYAQRLLDSAAPGDWNYGNAIYKGNTILGRIALGDGNVAAAKVYLLASAKTPGSPQLDSFGPNTALARDLLEKGERDVVLEYFKLCGKFWEMGGDDLKKWTATVKVGGMPDWGAHLEY